jgi:membrane-bound lytic murein transglycosylase D
LPPETGDIEDDFSPLATKEAFMAKRHLIRRVTPLCVAVVLCFVFSARARTACEDDPASAAVELPALVEAIRISPPLDFCGEPVPLDHTEVAERLETELLLMTWNQPQVILWLKRAGRYFPEIEEILGQEGVPDDLKYLAVIESGLRPHAGSAAGAIGFWQFIRPTAQRYGLTVDHRKDLRRNLAASTRAAARYLKDLYAQFGSWHLAAAAYNMGEQGVAAEMLAQQVDDYYRLYLYLETQRYVPKAVVAKLIMSDPRRFGFPLGPGDVYTPYETESVDVTLAEEVPLQLLAQAAGCDFKAIKDLNPELRGHYLAAGRHELKVPAGGSEGFHQRLPQILAEHRDYLEQRVYVVRPGDNLSLIAERFGVPLQALRIWNRIDLRKPIHPGDRLVVRPPREALVPDKDEAQ